MGKENLFEKIILVVQKMGNKREELAQIGSSTGKTETEVSFAEGGVVQKCDAEANLISSSHGNFGIRSILGGRYEITKTSEDNL